MNSFVLATAIIAAVLGLHAPTLGALVDLWWDSATYSHGFLVFPLAGALWWQRRRTVVAARPQPQMPGFIALVVLSGGMLLCDLASFQTGSALLLPAVIVAAVWAACGWTVSRSLLLPTLVFYCAVPVWSALTPVLQWSSAAAAAAICDALGIQLVREGTAIEIAPGTFEVAPGCSGTNFLLVALSLGLYVGELHRMPPGARLAIVAAAAAIAMASNAVRIAILVALGDWTEMRHFLVAEDHYLFGWLVFAAALGAFIAGVELWARRRRPDGAAPPAQRAAPIADSHPALKSSAAVLLTAALAPTLSWGLQVLPAASGAAASIGLPDVAGWAAASPLRSDWRPQFLGADREWHATYVGEGTRIVIYRNAYFGQSAGRELISSQNALVPNGTWRSHPLAAGRPRGGLPAARLATTAPDGREWLVTFWYDIDGRLVVSDLGAKLAHALHRVARVPENAGIVALAAACDPSCDVAAATIEAFVATAGGRERLSGAQR